MSRLPQIVQQTTLSEEQRPAVVARGDVAVTAGAGAGKTRTLVARYLALLDAGLSPRQVVAITFTRKAAREMRNRVRADVRHYLARTDLSDPVRSRWQATYNDLDAARIGTIHSLCGEILRHHPAEAGIDPRFEMLEEGQMALLRARAVDEALAWAADEAETVPLFATWGERGLRDLVGRMMAQRLDADEALAALPRDGQALRERWETQVAASREEALAALRARADFLQAWQALRAASPLAEEDRQAVQRRQALAALGEGGAPSIEALAALDGIDLRGGSAGAWPGGREELRQVKDALRTLRDLWRAAAGWLTLALGEVDETLIERYPALRALYERACAGYEAAKRERPALDFDDLEAGAVRLLRAHEGARRYWQSTIRALLVDEFQDTNGRQRELLELLNEGEARLFVVGDGKQSIYRFRGADVTVYRQVQREIEGRGQAFDLATSYRAHRALIEALNALLEPILGSGEDPARPYVEPFRPLAHHRRDPVPGVRPPYVELHLALGSKSEGALERAARALVARLVELVRNTSLEYGDIAILCRATRSFPAYESALEEAGVPFLTVAGRGFYERPEVRDVLNALQALDDPTDDLALAGLLRSPACRLPDMALYRLRRMQRERGLPSLWDALCGRDQVAGDLDAGEVDLCRQARELIGRLHARVGRAPVADVLKAFLDGTGYRAALLRAGQGRGARNVSKLLADAQSGEMVGVGAFLEYVGQLRDVGTREGEAHTVSEGAVQVMSVHAAKGLEFPVVVIGDASRRSPGPRGLLIDRALGALPPLQEERLVEGAVERLDAAVYRLAQRSARDQEEAESDRLLYVAMTRAKEMLLISGAVGRSPDGWLKRLDEALPLGEWVKEITTEDTEGTERKREEKREGKIGITTEGTEGTERKRERKAEGTTEGTERTEAKREKEREAETAVWEVGGQAVRCTAYREGGEIPLPAAVRDVSPAPLALPETPPLLRALRPEPLVADEEAGEAARDPPRRAWRVVPDRDRPTAPAWVVGQIVHGALEGWTFPDGGAGYARWAEAEARGCGLTDAREIGDAVRRAGRMLALFQGTALYARMEGAGARLHEVPYSVLDGEGRLERGVIDALFREGEGWTLVEFKTDRVPDEAALEELLEREDYVPQVARYLAAAERLLGARPRAALCLLNVGGRVRVVGDRWG